MKTAKAIATMMLALATWGAQAGVVYYVNFDQPAQSPGPDPYVAGPGEILPAGMTNTRLANANIIVPSIAGPQGNNVLSMTLGGGWANTQGYRFGADGTQFFGTQGPVILNAWTFEAFVKPNFSGPKTATSTIWDSEVWAPSYGGNALFVDQYNGMMTFRPAVGSPGYGEIISTIPLQAGQWYHIAAVVRPTGGAGQQTELYINGVLDGTGSYPLSWETQGIYKIPGYFSIGSVYWPVNLCNWQGEIDAFAISDEALGPDSFVLREVPQPGIAGLLGMGAILMACRRRR